MTELLEPAQIDAAIERLGWQRHGDELVKVWTGKDFAAALAYVNSVGAAAEEANHHPDIEIRRNKVTLHLSTHTAGGITKADLDLARQLDAISA